MKFISKAEDEYQKFVCKEFNRQAENIRKLKQEKKINEELLCNVEKCIKKWNASILQICEDKIKNKTFICVQDKRKIRCNCDFCKNWLEGAVNIFIISSLTLSHSNSKYTDVPYIQTKFLEDSVYIYELHCDHREGYYEDKGYGTYLIEMLIQLAKKNNCKKISGKLSSVDTQTEIKKEKRNGFYKKLGFELSFEDDKHENGSVCLKLL